MPSHLEIDYNELQSHEKTTQKLGNSPIMMTIVMTNKNQMMKQMMRPRVMINECQANIDNQFMTSIEQLNKRVQHINYCFTKTQQETKQKNESIQ